MAESKQNTTKTPKKVTLRLKKINKPNANQEEFYSVNFKNVIIRRGEEVEIGEEFAEAIENSQLAEDEAITFAEKQALREPKSEI